MNRQVLEIQELLSATFPMGEAREIALWIMEEVSGKSRTEILVESKPINIPNLKEIIHRVSSHEPLQYVFGHTLWRGLDLTLSSATLIPRPETSELIDWINDMAQQGILSRTSKVLDIGTGSGCIAIALKKCHPSWDVTGMDIDPKCLTIAQLNAQRYQADIHWVQADILTDLAAQSVDIIVSNPPYITKREKNSMETNVLCYEPHSALFVPDDDPLLFYQAIARKKWSQHLFFEVNHQYAQEVINMLIEFGYNDTCIHQDIYGKNRMVYAQYR